AQRRGGGKHSAVFAITHDIDTKAMHERLANRLARVAVPDADSKAGTGGHSLAIGIEGDCTNRSIVRQRLTNRLASSSIPEARCLGFGPRQDFFAVRADGHGMDPAWMTQLQFQAVNMGPPGGEIRTNRLLHVPGFRWRQLQAARQPEQTVIGLALST